MGFWDYIFPPAARSAIELPCVPPPPVTVWELTNKMEAELDEKAAFFVTIYTNANWCTYRASTEPRFDMVSGLRYCEWQALGGKTIRVSLGRDATVVIAPKGAGK